MTIDRFADFTTFPAILPLSLIYTLPTFKVIVQNLPITEKMSVLASLFTDGIITVKPYLANCLTKTI